MNGYLEDIICLKHKLCQTIKWARRMICIVFMIYVCMAIIVILTRGPMTKLGQACARIAPYCSCLITHLYLGLPLDDYGSTVIYVHFGDTM